MGTDAKEINVGEFIEELENNQALRHKIIECLKLVGDIVGTYYFLKTPPIAVSEEKKQTLEEFSSFEDKKKTHTVECLGLDDPFFWMIQASTPRCFYQNGSEKTDAELGLHRWHMDDHIPE